MKEIGKMIYHMKRRIEIGFGMLFYKPFYKQIPHNVRNKAYYLIRARIVDDIRLSHVLNDIYNKLTDDLKGVVR